MNENGENIDSLLDAAPDVEHLRLEVSENGEVFYHIDDVTLMMLRRCQQLLFSFFFCEQERGREGEGSFLFFQSGSLQDSSVSGVPFRINEKQ